mmetsp:Transcript_30764/g.56919  ORF Transcript_30764/g.56919 Transcript_30764/m.56919 type:complete len:681 (+) Transcript_30764:279-2321(+)|eukprot:CAMPEP_0196137114 /NCGR_PEP_ID=MMETSP0910-20130528/5205_1 /TAXON_ID=49265 /ORGANISM="Thalassiosira rotula, Strain GSO102" /LENGTH=680 /DNA_ID=CAMNT_0041397533 /DNA_START=240 /DNA_END=2282 /DNA_ORIENTATION=+
MFSRSLSTPPITTTSATTTTPSRPSYRWSLSNITFINNINNNINSSSNLHNELILSTELIFRSKLTYLLLFGPIALIGKTGLFGESTCFVLAGLTLIPLAERLSFVTEEVASHTNQTIGALLNATFGNAPELLISSAALQEGFYRVVQLTLLGSMLTNLLFVFGLSCLIGGLRFQVQELRIVSGNASIGMLMLAVAGLALPAALMLSDEMVLGSEEKEYIDKNGDGVSDINDGPTESMIGFSRWNATIMIVGYLLYLLFQLGSHKDEFEDLEEEEEREALVGETEENGGNGSEDNVDEEEGQVVMPRKKILPKTKKKARKNKFCHRLFVRGYKEEENDIIDDIDDNNEHGIYQQITRLASIREMEMSPRNGEGLTQETIEGVQTNNGITSGMSDSLPDYIEEVNDEEHTTTNNSSRIPQSYPGGDLIDEDTTIHSSNITNRRRVTVKDSAIDPPTSNNNNGLTLVPQSPDKSRRSTSNKSHCSDGSDDDPPYIVSANIAGGSDDGEETHMSFKAGLLWLFLITISISAMSDILVDTIDGFAFRYGISEVFTSLVILPYFSNIAEQVSALIFAYRNEMDLCVGITVGSAVQIALFVLPGSVLIGWAMDRSMSLFFRGFETCCLIFSVVSVAAVLQGGTTNWLVGAYLLGVYFMVAAGFWFHELENLTVDGELTNLHNHTAF